jgi:Domain of unknown function (DUF4404)
MPSDHLRELLEELHAELRRTEAVDDRSRALLREVDSVIQSALARTGSAQSESLIERLRETVDRFEGTHPALTEAVTRVLDSLVSMGI